ncbi:MAG: hypothetical protein Fur0035_22380 [Anaerolineales bacterium]
MNITVFGSSQPQPESPAYAQAYALGKLLAGRGNTVITGGYAGTMEAVSRGASEVGGRVIGVTCQEIENWRGAKANPWVQEERKFPTLLARLEALITACDAAIALPGGPGTLTEISLMWNLLIVEALPPRPLLLVGEGWQSIFHQVFQSTNTFTAPSAKKLLLFAANVETAISLLDSKVS